MADIETTPDEDFTAAFAQFGADEAPATPAAVVAEESVTPAVAAEIAPAADATPPVETVVDDATPPALDATPVVEEQQPATENDDLLARLAAMVSKQAPATPEPRAEPTPAQLDQPELYTAEEKTFLADYEKDWPDVAKAESLRRRGEYQQLVNHVFSEVAKELGPVAETLRTLAERAHLTDLRDSVEDYDDVRDKVIDWVNNQPNYLQNAYKHVIQQGTPSEISDLVSRYKQATGVTTPVAVPAKRESELPLTTKQAVASLAPVSSKRSVVVATPDLEDFDGAFAEAAKSL